MSTYNLPALQDSSLSTYINEINKFPMLEEQEEYMLAVRYKEHGDMQAAQKLVTSHLRLVVKIASKFRGYGLPMADIISEGNIGLMQAVKKFEPEKGFRLSTYAMWWIKAQIHEHVLKSWSIVKVGTSATQKKLFFNLKRMKGKILNSSGDGALTNANFQEIADDLDVKKSEVIEMDQLMSSGTQSLNRVMFDDSEAEQIDYLEDTSENQEIALGNAQEASISHNLLAQAMETLNEREKDILIKRRLSEEPLTLEDVSAIYNISRERVRQIENVALEKLQKFMLPKRSKFAA